MLVNLEKKDGTKLETGFTIGTLSELKQTLEVGELVLAVYIDNLKVFYPIQSDEDLVFIKDNCQMKIVDSEEVNNSLHEFGECSQIQLSLILRRTHI